MYSKTLFLVLNNLRAGRHIQLFIVVLLLSAGLKDMEFKVLSRCHTAHSHTDCVRSILSVYLA